MEKQENEVPCPICEYNEEYIINFGTKDKDTKNDWILCNHCNYWLHGIRCENLSKSKFEDLTKKKLTRMCLTNALIV